MIVNIQVNSEFITHTVEKLVHFYDATVLHYRLTIHVQQFIFNNNNNNVVGCVVGNHLLIMTLLAHCWPPAPCCWLLPMLITMPTVEDTQCV